MSSADCKDEQCQNNLNKIYSDLLHLITSFEKGSGSELTVRLRQVESGLEQLRESVRSIPDIQNNEQRQKQRIASLYRVINHMLYNSRMTSTINCSNHNISDLFHFVYSGIFSAPIANSSGDSCECRTDEACEDAETQIKLKDELIQSFLHYDIVDGSERVNIKRD